jgi:hypothetical protein
MNPEPHTSIEIDDETLPEDLIAALRALPSEHATPSAATDAAIFAEARASLAASRRRKIIPRIWPTLAAAACLALAFAFLSQRQPSVPEQHATSTPEDPYAVILREVTSLFPDQVRAIMTDGGELQIALSDAPLASNARAVVIEACGNGGCTVVITYVGQVIEIERQQITIQAREDGFMILDGAETSAPDLQITSRTI